MTKNKFKYVAFPSMNIFMLGFFLFFNKQACGQNQSPLLNYVNPLTGTAATTTATKHSQGSEQFANTIPAVGLPFGMTQWTPQTQTTEQKCVAPYYYTDKNFSGIRGTHWLSGSCTQDYGSFTIMPISGSLNTKDYAVPYDHTSEQSMANYYGITLNKYSLKTEVTGLLRSSVIRITMNQTDSLYILITPNSDTGEGAIRIDSVNNEITGYNPVHRLYQGFGKPAGFNGYFVIQVQNKFDTKGIFDHQGVSRKGSVFKHSGLGAFIGFKLKKGSEIVLRIGTSFTSINEARENLKSEIAGMGFNDVRKKAGEIWEKTLHKILVKSGSDTSKRIFYTAMYHSMQQPRLFNDVDGTYPLFDHQYQYSVVKGFNYFDDFSMWDIYRAELPLYEILDTKLITDLASSIVLKGIKGGWLPIFPCWNNYTGAMIGDHSIAFLSSVLLKDIKILNRSSAYELMRKNAFSSPIDSVYNLSKGRRALKPYLKFGYVPLEEPVKEAFHKNEQVSRTLEYAYDDYALAMVAKSQNRKSDYRKLRARASNYKNVFDKSVGYMNGRYQDGTWFTDFNADKKLSFITEGTPRQYSFYVPQDIKGLTALLGGRANFERELDSLFSKNEYWHGNEPGHHIPFLYNYTASPWKTQRQVRSILKDDYGDGPGGLSGNDDAGQMSAWCIFAMLGLYPIDPVCGKFALFAPYFSDIKITLPNKKFLLIVTHAKNKNCVYIHKVRLNGKGYKKDFISYKTIMGGGKIEFDLREKPDKTWANKVNQQPFGWSSN